MRILFFTSGSGSTAEYVINKLIAYGKQGVGIELVGWVYEPNEELDLCFNRCKINYGDNNVFNNLEYIRVNRNEYTTNKYFHNSIWEKIVRMNKKDINLIMLLGWMHIIPEVFIEQCNNVGIEIVNLHPTLQYQLIGRDIYPKIWNMYQDGMIRETGCMVHMVSESLDRGSLIHQLKLNLNSCHNFNDYKEAMYGGKNSEGLEKQCVWEALLKLYNIFNSKNNMDIDITPSSMASGYEKAGGLILKHRGKVRDIYESPNYPNYLFVQTSDRISANDIVISYLPGKGVLLNQINTFWHKLLGIRQMVISSGGGMMVIRKMNAIPLEIIIRRTLTGSLWKAYSQNGLRIINGNVLSDKMNEGDKFGVPLITPTTKGTHDVPISFQEIIEKGILNKKEVDEIKQKSLDLFLRGEAFMKKIGIEIIDTKFEFAFAEDGSLEVIDEVFTPDSSRFIVDGKRMDKDILRKWATDNENHILEHKVLVDGCRGVELPNEVRDRLISNYSQFLNKCLSARCEYEGKREYIEGPYNILINNMVNNVENNVVNSLERLEKIAVIIAGSKSDVEHVNKIRMELGKHDILAWVYYASAHKNTQAVMNILNKYETMVSKNICKLIYITVAGMSNALSGVVAANTANPVIACPPFADKADFQVNINSTLQMPSGVPTACILRPDNLASFCKRIFNMV